MFNYKYSYRTRDAAIFPLIVVVTSIVYSFLFTAVITRIAMANGATTAEEVQAFSSLPWVNVINMLVGQVFLIGAFVIYSLIKGRDIVTASTIKGKIKLVPMLIVVGITILCVFGFSYLISLLDIGLISLTGKASLGASVPEGFLGYLVTVIVFAIVPAVVEEFVYRGAVYNGLAKSYTPVKAILLSAVIFTLMHFSIFQTVYQMIMGAIAAIICYYTGSIIYAIVFHMINNFTVVTLGYIVPNMFVVGQQSALNIILIVLGAIAAAAGIVYMFVLLKKACKKYDTKAEVIVEKSEQEQLIEKTQGLSEYDIRQMSAGSLKDKTVVILMIIVLVGIWIALNIL